MYELEFTCHEKHGTRLRKVVPLTPTPSSVVPVFEKLRAWNPSITGEQIMEFYRPDKLYMTVDEIGLVWMTKHVDSIEGHFVFWDGVLRGREDLIKGLAKVAMNIADVDQLWVEVPKEQKMILAFLKRCGFLLTEHNSFFTAFLHSSPRS